MVGVREGLGLGEDDWVWERKFRVVEGDLLVSKPKVVVMVRDKIS